MLNIRLGMIFCLIIWLDLSVIMSLLIIGLYCKCVFILDWNFKVIKIICVIIKWFNFLKKFVELLD